MRSFEISDTQIKSFMNDLLINEKFDSFYLYEARVKTALDYYISGKINKEFFADKNENEVRKASIPDMQGEVTYIAWKEIKHTVFDMIKGNRLPISFKIVLMFNRENIARLVEMHNLPMDESNISALFYHIVYENEKLNITTGTSIKIFTMDKSVDHVWDETVEKYYIE